MEFAEPLPDGEFDDPEFVEPEFAEPEFDDPEFAEPGLEASPFGVEPLAAPGVAGKGPHGEPVGLVPGVFGLFGFTVEGSVLLPGVGGFGEFEPGTVEGVFGVVALVGGFTGVVCGVVEPVGGVVVPGVWACPGVPCPPVGAVPAGLLCAITPTAQNRSIDKKTFLADIRKPPGLKS